jgi:hypothetical protein
VSAGPDAARSPQMPHMQRKRYAVVSCHVERPLDDRCWSLFASLQAKRPGGFRIAALMRPPDADAGEGEQRWLERARAAAEHGPLGLHTHFVSPDRARPPAPGPEHAARVRREAEWMEAKGLAPTLFCAGGWYMDEALAETVADLGLVDCSATAFRPGYLTAGDPRLHLEAPARVDLRSGARLLELPSTHSLGMAARAAFGRLGQNLVHVYFHDTDLLSARRRASLATALRVLGRRRRAIDLDELVDAAAEVAPEVPFGEAFAGRNAPSSQ